MSQRAATGKGFDRVERIVLRVANVEAAAKFYSETLGLHLDRRQPRAAALKFAGGTTELIVHDDRQHGDIEVVIGVSDVRALRDQAEALQLTFLSPPAPSAHGWRATVRDPFGNVWTLADQGGDAEPEEPSIETGGLFGEAVHAQRPDDLGFGHVGA